MRASTSRCSSHLVARRSSEDDEGGHHLFDGFITRGVYDEEHQRFTHPLSYQTTVRFERVCMTSFEVFALTLLVQLICTNGDSISTGSASSPSASSISSSSVNCTSQERNETVGLFLNLTTIDECAGDTSISDNRIMVYPACGSACATKIQEVGDELPDCYYYVAGYDSGNMKEEVTDSLAQCELWIPPPPVWVSIYADHNLSSPEASGSYAGVDETYGSFVYDNSAASTSVVTLVWVSAGVLFGLML